MDKERLEMTEKMRGYGYRPLGAKCYCDLENKVFAVLNDGTHPLFEGDHRIEFNSDCVWDVCFIHNSENCGALFMAMYHLREGEKVFEPLVIIANENWEYKDAYYFEEVIMKKKR